MGMTREEAKSYIGELKMYANSQGWDEEYQIACDVAMNELEQESTTKNDLGVEYVSRKEVEKLVFRFLQKGTDENIAFYEHFLDLPSITPQEPTTKSDLGVDCVARQDVERFIEGFINEYTPEEELEFINLELNGLKHLPSVTPQEPTTKNDLAVDYRSLEDIKKLVERKADALDGVMLDAGGVIIGLYFAIANDLPSVTPQEPQTFKWCETCKEYDQEKHCCHRWSKVIRDTVEEMKQEPILEQIRAEIEKWHKDGTNWSDIRLMEIEDILDKEQGRK